MHCPNDKHELEQHAFHSVSIDECPLCHGKWFDRDELRRAKDATDEDLRWLDFELFEEKDGKYEKSEGHKHCPKGHGVMHILTYATSKVIIDQCPHCHGIWLDNHEFEKILSYLETYVNTEPADALEEDVKKKFEKLFSGHEGLVSELKDLFAILKLYEMRLGAEHPKQAEDLKNLLIYFPFK